jgi:hypothetical protein
MGVLMLVPTAEPGVAITPYSHWIDPPKFAGVVGFAANSLPGSTDFLAALSSGILARLPGTSAWFQDKGDTPQRSSDPLSELELADVADSCDAVVLAYGHCGSCTSATVRDAVALARLGRPVVAIVIPSFAAEATQVARAAGMPDVPVYVLPGPMISRPAVERAAVAEAVVDDVFACLVGTPAVDDVLARLVGTAG